MRKEDFVVGKIYYTGATKWYYCGHDLIAEDHGLFQLASDSANEKKGYVARFPFNYTWKEYREPRKGTRWMNVYSSPRGDIYTATYETKENADKLKTMLKIACIEVPWVEGQGL